MFSLCFTFRQEQVSNMSYNEKSDIWSLGCLLYELCALHPPFLAMDQHSLALKIRDGKFKPLPNYFSEELGEFINWMLQVNVSAIPNTAYYYNTSLCV